MTATANQEPSWREAAISWATPVFGTGWALGWLAVSVIVIRHSLMDPGSNDLAYLEQLLPWIAISLVAFQGNYHQSRLEPPAAPSIPKRATPKTSVNLALSIDHLRSIARASYAARSLVIRAESSKHRIQRRPAEGKAIAASDGHPGIVRPFFFAVVSGEYRAGGRYLQGSDYRARNWEPVARWLRRTVDEEHPAAVDLPGLATYRRTGPRKAAEAALARWETNDWVGSMRRQFLRTDIEGGESGAPSNLTWATSWASQAARSGHARAQYFMACLNTFVSQDRQHPGNAFNWCQRAARQGVPAAQALLGDFHRWGFGTPPDAEQALQWWRRAAEEGWALAQYRLGCFYYFSRADGEDNSGRAQDAKQGIYWLRQAAEQGHAWAQAWLGRAYLIGLGVRRDLKDGVLWTRRAAGNGVAMAQYKFGDLCRWGRGVPRDHREATHWFRLAAAQGDPNAQTRLGHLYRAGRAVPRNNSQAAWWYRAAAEQGHVEAQYLLACLYDKGWGVPQDAGWAFEWYLASARQGRAAAELEVGLRYLEGRGVERSPEAGVVWIKRAACRGIPLAQHHLGVCFAAGHGVEQNPKKAFFWHTLAAARAAVGSPDARAKFSGLLTSAQRRDILDAAERWIAVFAEWKSGRRRELPNVKGWL